MSRELNQYILKEYARLHSVMEQREFMEKVRFLMMAGEKEFSGYYSRYQPAGQRILLCGGYALQPQQSLDAVRLFA